MLLGKVREHVQSILSGLPVEKRDYSLDIFSHKKTTPQFLEQEIFLGWFWEPFPQFLQQKIFFGLLFYGLLSSERSSARSFARFFEIDGKLNIVGHTE
jgi:hypothetical protein